MLKSNLWKITFVVALLSCATASIAFQFPNLIDAISKGNFFELRTLPIDYKRVFDLVIALGIYLGAYALGNITVGFKFRQDNNIVDRFLFTLTIGIVELCLITFIISLFGLLYSFLWLILLIIILVQWRHLSRTLVEVFREIVRYFHLERRHFGTVLFVVLLILFISNMGIHFLSNLYPTTDTDALNYHLFPAKLYAESHGWQSLPDNPNFWPENMEMLYSLAFLVGSQMGAQLIHFLSVPLLLITLIAMVKRLRLFPLVTVTMVMFLSVPIVSYVLGDSTTNDLPVALFLLISVYALYLHIETGERIYFVTSALALGLGLGTKHTVILVLPFYLFALAWFQPQNQKRSIYFFMKDAFVFFVVAFAVSLPWYLKSFLQTGNPIWPAFSNLLPGVYNEIGAHRAATAKATYGIWNLGEMYRIPWLMCFGDGMKLDGTLGPLPLALLFSLLANRSGFKLRKVLVIFIITSFVMWLVLIQEVRYIIFLLIPFFLLSLNSIHSCYSDFPQRFMKNGFRIYFGIVMLILILSLPFFYMIQHDPQRYTPLLQRRFPQKIGSSNGSESTSTSRLTIDDWYLEKMLVTYPIVQHINSSLSDSVKIFYMGGEPPFLYLKKPLVWDQRSIEVRDYVNAKTPAELLDILRREKITHIMYQRAQFRSHWFSDLESQWLFSNLKLLKVANDVYLYEIRVTPPSEKASSVLYTLMQHQGFNDSAWTKETTSDGSIHLNFLADFLNNRRNSLVLLERAGYEWKTAIPDSAVLSFGVAKLFPDLGDGGIVEVGIRTDTSYSIIYKHSLDPQYRMQDRIWQDTAIDLQAYSKKDARITFRSQIGTKGDAFGDWFAFSEPMILRKNRNQFE